MPEANTGPFVMATQAWVSALKAAQAFKDKRFAPEAAEGIRFFSGPYDFFFNQIRTDRFFSTGNSQANISDIVVTCNKVAELVQIFGPVLYQKNPDRRATIPVPPKIDPNIFAQDQQLLAMAQQAYDMAGMEMLQHQAVASIFEAIENITPEMHDLKSNARRAIDEALIKGLGLLWHETRVNPATGTKSCGSFWKTVDGLLLDPDAHSIDGITWCAYSTLKPRWLVERENRLPPGTLNGSCYSLTANDNSLYQTPDLRKKDMVEEWCIWSKIGVGGRLPGNEYITDVMKAAYEMMGDYCYLKIVPNHPWPLNLPPGMFQQENPWAAAQLAVQWPTPFWLDGKWPFTPFYFHEVPKDPWPLSHLTPGMGELKFLNWAFSKLANKIKTTSRDFIILDAAVPDEVKQIILNGSDLSVLKMAMEGKDPTQLIHWLQHPPWNKDIWDVIGAISQQFDQRVGLTDLMYGLSSKQFRSANEAEKKYEAVNVRPDDMADKVQDAMSAAADREKVCNYWHLTPDDVASYLGPVGRMAWQTFVYAQPPAAVFQIHMRIEADSTQKPNKTQIVDNMNQAMQMLLNPLFSVATSGQVNPFNALVGDWCDSVGLRDKQRYMVQAPVLPPEPQAPAA